MPHLVQMQSQHAKDLVTITVSLDNNEETPDCQAKVLKVLQKASAGATTNVILDEPSDLWKEKLDIGGPPLLVIFDRDNKLIKTFTFEEFAEVEKYVVGAVMKK